MRHIARYKTDVAHPDYSTTVPHACGDYRVQDVGSANPRFIRLTMGTLPSNKEARNRAAIPVAAIFQPMASLRPDEDVVPLVDLGEHGPVRCTRCHGYMNPFCRFVENGSQWLCNLCNHSNETREDYFNHLDMRGIRVDKLERPELCKGEENLREVSLSASRWNAALLDAFPGHNVQPNRFALALQVGGKRSGNTEGIAKL